MKIRNEGYIVELFPKDDIEEIEIVKNEIND